MKKTVVKLAICNEKEKKKALQVLSSLWGIDTTSMDMIKKELTVIGYVDPADVVSKLKKWKPNIVSVNEMVDTGRGEVERIKYFSCVCRSVDSPEKELDFPIYDMAARNEVAIDNDQDSFQAPGYLQHDMTAWGAVAF